MNKMETEVSAEKIRKQLWSLYRWRDEIKKGLKKSDSTMWDSTLSLNDLSIDVKFFSRLIPIIQRIGKHHLDDCLGGSDIVRESFQKDLYHLLTAYRSLAKQNTMLCALLSALHLETSQLMQASKKAVWAIEAFNYKFASVPDLDTEEEWIDGDDEEEELKDEQD